MDEQRGGEIKRHWTIVKGAEIAALQLMEDKLKDWKWVANFSKLAKSQNVTSPSTTTLTSSLAAFLSECCTTDWQAFP